MLQRRADAQQICCFMQSLVRLGHGFHTIGQHLGQPLRQALSITRHQLACSTGAPDLQAHKHIGGDDEDQRQRHNQ